MSLVRLVRVVQAVVVAVADVDAWDAVSVVAGEEVAEAGAALGLALPGGLVGPVGAVLVAWEIGEMSFCANFNVRCK